ncbi:hypothetical protein MAR_015314 [Mya arenaria]|uniref:Uncharacterized protein n=1 Tax=Mya arenaria TaxID=6604 RepID=A0ABY7FGP9_MYAAR|nr:hypothetical protein MAR_015314 [Mya arenaria]
MAQSMNQALSVVSKTV